MLEDTYSLALRVMHDYLVECFEDADFLAIMNDDPECVQLLDADWDKVFDAFQRIKLVSIKLQ